MSDGQSLVGNLALADDVGGAGEKQIGDMSVSIPLYVNIQGTAGHIHPDVFSGDLAQQRQHSYHRAGTGAAGIGEVLHPPLIGALIYMVRADDLVKVHIM